MTINFPRGRLPVQGYHCPHCHEDVIEAAAADEAQKQAKALGMFGSELPLLRRLTRSGGQLALYVPREIERALGLVAGRKVKVFARGKEIVVEPV